MEGHYLDVNLRLSLEMRVGSLLKHGSWWGGSFSNPDQRGQPQQRQSVSIRRMRICIHKISHPTGAGLEKQ